MTLETESMIGKVITCAETGKTFLGATVGVSTNYATDSYGNYYSDEGVDLRERKELLDTSKPYFAYISCDGYYITGWKGNNLMRIISSVTCKLTRMSYTHSAESYKSIRAIDDNGQVWYGRGSAGFCVTLRAIKKVG